MRVVKSSSSSINLYNHCSFAYFMNYILCMENRSGKAALQGSICHKVFEFMARRQKRHKAQVDPMVLLEAYWDKMCAQKEHSHIDIRKVTTRIDKETNDYKEAADFRKCRLAIEEVCDNPHYNPANLNVVDAERWFRLEFPGDDWKCLDENNEEHQFSTRGLIDLAHQIDQDTLEIVDWKTGARKNFYTGEEITEDTLCAEVQPRLYHLASSFLYPQFKNVIITFYYTNDGGPISISLSDEDLSLTVEYLQRFFNEIKKDTLLRRNRSWKCKMCSFNKVCDRVWSDFHTMGGHYVLDKYYELTHGQQEQLANGEYDG